MSLSPARADTLVWVFIYGGMVTASIGAALRRGGAGWGWLLVGAGAALVVAGIVLIWIRSRAPS